MILKEVIELINQELERIGGFNDEILKSKLNIKQKSFMATLFTAQAEILNHLKVTILEREQKDGSPRSNPNS